MKYMVAIISVGMEKSGKSSVPSSELFASANAIAQAYVFTDLTAGMTASEKISKNIL